MADLSSKVSSQDGTPYHLATTVPFLWLSGLVLSLSMAAPLGRWVTLLLGILFVVLRVVPRSGGPLQMAISLFQLLLLVTPVVPLFGAEVTLGVACIFLLLLPQKLYMAGMKWIGPLVLLGLTWSIAQLCVAFDWSIPVTLYQAYPEGSARMAGVSAWLQNAPPPWVLSLLGTLRFAVIGAIFGATVALYSSRDRWALSLTCGVIGSTSIAAVQICGVYPGLFPNQTSYWTAAGRIAGSFSDPNAFGVFAAMVLPILGICWWEGSGKLRALYGVVACAFALVGLYSGSRTFFVILAVYGVATLLCLPRGRFRFIGVIASICIVCTTVVGLYVAPHDLLEKFPRALSRLALSIQGGSFDSSFFSRFAFLQIAVRVFLDNPISGVGLHQFSGYVVPYAGELRYILGTWSDNANNFYLGIAAELGLIGMALLVLIIRRLQWRDGAPHFAMVSVAAVGVSLLTGPHIDFMEISILTGVILGSGCLPRQRQPENAAVYIGVALCIGAMVVGRVIVGDAGFYPWEREPGGAYYRWTRGSARLTVTCTDSGIASVFLRAVRPELGEKPLSVTLSSPYRTERLILRDSTVVEAHLPCTPRPGTPHRISLPIEIRPNESWIPLATGLGGDPRLLGVQVVTPGM